MSKQTKYVIQSNSERGFWSNKLGWVYGSTTATKFNENDIESINKIGLPVTGSNDAKWQVYSYGE